VTEVYIAGKDLRGALRSRFFIGVAVLVPLLVTSLFFFAFGGRVKETGKGPGMAPVRTVVVNEDAGSLQLGRVVVNTLSSPQLREVLYCVEVMDTLQARRTLLRRQADVAVVIPTGFSAAVTDSASRAEVVLLADPVKTIGPAVVQSVLQRLLDAFSGSTILLNTYRSAARAAGVAPDSRVSEHEDGTLARLFTTPVGRARILGGKMLSVITTVAVQATVLVAASALLFGLRWGQAGSVLLALAGTVAASSGFGVMLASFIKTTRQGGPVLGGGLSVAGMLGGLFTQAVPNMPVAFNRVALALPQGWVMRGWNVAIAGRSVPDMFVPLGAMLAWGVVCFAIGVLVFRRRFA
jgi:ABC-type Na+ efflux pump permease subunit